MGGTTKNGVGRCLRGNRRRPDAEVWGENSSFGEKGGETVRREGLEVGGKGGFSTLEALAETDLLYK